MSLCLAVGGQITALAFTAFTLSWTHSVERIRWQEDWQLTPAGLALIEARVQGSGAGMEPPPEATLTNGWWRWKPNLPEQGSLVLAASGATGGGWTLCSGNNAVLCLELGRERSNPIKIAQCSSLEQAASGAGSLPRSR